VSVSMVERLNVARSAGVSKPFYLGFKFDDQ
jgi:hypothetical protein